MLRGYESYSFKHGKKRTQSLLIAAVRLIIVLILLYIIVTEVLLVSARVATDSMAPTILAQERIIVSPVAYAVLLPFSRHKIFETGGPGRGDIVVIEPPYLEEETVVQRVLNFFARFFTLQRRMLFNERMSRAGGVHLVKRIIGVPGDTIVLKQHIAYIRPANQTKFYRESELVPFEYEVKVDAIPVGWPESLPFSGTTDELELGEAEYYVLGDNRNSSSDSRSWGPISGDRIFAKVLLRYWPLDKLGPP
jgi:signal peptidase I